MTEPWVIVVVTVDHDDEEEIEQFLEVIGPFDTYPEAEEFASKMTRDADQHVSFACLRREPHLTGLASRTRETS